MRFDVLIMKIKLDMRISWPKTPKPDLLLSSAVFKLEDKRYYGVCKYAYKIKRQVKASNF